MEAPTGIEPVMEVLQTSALPLGYGAMGKHLALAMRPQPSSKIVALGCMCVNAFSNLEVRRLLRRRHTRLGVSLVAHVASVTADHIAIRRVLPLDPRL